MNIRIATDSDLDVLNSFQDKLVIFERPFDVTIKKTRVRYYSIKRYLRSEKCVVYVVEDGGKAIGCGLGELKKEEGWSINDYIGYIGLLFIEDGYRGKGYGKELVQKLTDWFKEKKVTDVRLKVYAQNSKAIEAYEKMGFLHLISEMKISV